MYRAVVPDGEQVAVKVFRAQGDDALTQRFQIEQDGMRRLSHPSIGGVRHNGVTADGEPFFVTDFVDGQPIDEHLDARRASVVQRVALLTEVCQTVSHAHEMGVLHRDLKPSNVLVRGDGSHVLLDFGIAKLIEPLEVADPSTLTRQSRVFTPHFASPEQAAGEAVSARCDVFSLGVLAYVLTSGRLPVYGEDGTRFDLPRDRAVLVRLAELRGTTPRRLRNELDDDLQRVLQAATTIDTDHRTNSVAGLREQLERWMSERGGDHRDGWWRWLLPAGFWRA